MTDPLDKLQALDAEATPGPWRWDEPVGRCLMGPGPTSELEARGVGTHVLVQGSSDLTRSTDADARFIAISRNVWPELLAVVQAAQAVRDAPKGGMREVEATNALVPALDALYARIDQEVPDASDDERNHPHEEPQRRSRGVHDTGHRRVRGVQLQPRPERRADHPR